MKLAEVCELIVDCEHKTAPTQTVGYPSIRTPNIGPGYFILDRVNRVSKETYDLWTKRAIPQTGDLIMAREAPVGNTAIITGLLRPCLGQRTLLIRPDRTKVEPLFLNYFLNGPYIQGIIHSKTNGATVAHLNMKDVRSLPLVSLPPIQEQQRIAGLLSDYDELIENNQRRIRILEEMVRSLYREWFVHFRFPGHDDHPLVLSALGKIPKGWGYCKLSELAEVNRAQITSRSAPQEISYIDIASVTTGAIETTTLYRFADAPGRARRIVKHGDVLWSCVRPNRRSYALVMEPDSGTIASTGFAVLTATKVQYPYLYLATTTDDFVAYLTNSATGSAYPAVSAKTFEDADILMPSSDVLDKFDATAIPMVEQAHKLRLQDHNLRKIRDLLLPRLLSGQIKLEAH